MNANWIESLWLVGDEWCLRWLVTLLHFLWQGVAIGAVAIIGSWLLRHRSASSRYVLHAVALLSLPVCVAVTFAVVDVPQSWRVAEARGEPVTVLAGAETMDAVELLPPAELSTLEPVVPVTESRGEQMTFVPPSESDETVVPEPMTTEQNTSDAPFVARIAPFLVAAYFAGALLCLLRLIAAVWGGHRLRRMAAAVDDPTLLEIIAEQSRRVGLKIKPVVAYCERVAVPTVVGVIRPMILLPVSLMTGLAPDQAAAIISHELAHIRRYDLLMNLLQRVIESLLFFHPVVWLISRRMSAEREACCDDLVVSSGHERLRYADALLRMAELCSLARQPDLAALAASGRTTSQFEHRIRRLINTNQQPRFCLTRAGVFASVALLVLLVASPMAVQQYFVLAQESQVAVGDDGVGAANAAGDGDQAADERVGGAFRLPDHWIIEDLRWLNGDRELISVSLQGGVNVRRWDVVNRKLLSEIKLASDQHGRPVHQGTLRLSADGSRAFAVTDAYVGVWDATTGELLRQLPIPQKEWAYDTVNCLDCSADGSVLVAGLGTTYFRTTLGYPSYGIAWDARSGAVLCMFEQEMGFGICDVAVSADGRRFATCSGRISLWETHTGKLLAEYTELTRSWESPDPKVISVNSVRGIDLSPDGRQLAIEGTFGVRLVDIPSGKLLRTIDAPKRYRPSDVVFSSDGQRIARHDPYKVVIWSVETGEQLYEIVTRTSVARFSRSGRHLAVGDSDFYAAVSIWPLAGEKKLDPLPPPEKTSRIDRVGENTHRRGEAAATVIDEWKPVWGESQSGILYGIAFTSQQRQFRAGERVPMAAFFRNVTDKPVRINVRPDYFWNVPALRSANGTAVDFERRPLLGATAHYYEDLQPGEAVGLLYFNFGLGDNPRPGRQHWHPFYKSPQPGKHRLTHSVSFRVKDLGADGKPVGDDWTTGELTSGSLEFEITAANAKEEQEGTALPVETLKPGQVLIPNARPDDVEKVRRLIDQLDESWPPRD